MYHRPSLSVTWLIVNPVAQASEEIIRRATLKRIPVVVRALPVQCWNCGRDDCAVAFIHLEGVTNGGEVVTANRSLTLAYSAELLTDAGHPKARTVKVRRNAATGTSYLSNGCLSCDALFGGGSLDDARFAALSEGRIAELPILATIQRPGVEWFSLIGLSWTTGRLS